MDSSLVITDDRSMEGFASMVHKTPGLVFSNSKDAEVMLGYIRARKQYLHDYCSYYQEVMLGRKILPMTGNCYAKDLPPNSYIMIDHWWKAPDKECRASIQRSCRSIGTLSKRFEFYRCVGSGNVMARKKPVQAPVVKPHSEFKVETHRVLAPWVGQRLQKFVVSDRFKSSLPRGVALSEASVRKDQIQFFFTLPDGGSASLALGYGGPQNKGGLIHFRLISSKGLRSPSRIARAVDQVFRKDPWMFVTSRIQSHKKNSELILASVKILHFASMVWILLVLFGGFLFRLRARNKNR